MLISTWIHTYYEDQILKELRTMKVMKTIEGTARRTQRMRRAVKPTAVKAVGLDLTKPRITLSEAITAKPPFCKWA